MARRYDRAADVAVLRFRLSLSVVKYLYARIRTVSRSRNPVIVRSRD